MTLSNTSSWILAVTTLVSGEFGPLSAEESVQVLSNPRTRSIIPLRLVLEVPEKPEYFTLTVKKLREDGSCDIIARPDVRRDMPCFYFGPDNDSRWRLEIPLFASQEPGRAYLLFREAGVYQLEWSFRVGAQPRMHWGSTLPENLRNREPKLPGREVGSVKHTLEVQPSVPADLAFFRGMQSKQFRSKYAAPVPGDRSEALAAASLMLHAATKPGYGKVFAYQYLTSLRKLVAEHCSSSFVPYAKNLVAKLEYDRLHIGRSPVPWTPDTVSSNPVYRSAILTAQQALKSADPLLRPRVLLEIALMKANVLDVAGAEADLERLQKEYGNEPFADQLIDLLNKQITNLRTRSEKQAPNAQDAPSVRP